VTREPAIAGHRETERSSPELRDNHFWTIISKPGITAEEALSLHLAILPTLATYLDRPFGAYRRILVPFVSTYWIAMFTRMRFRFRNPSLVEEALAAAMVTPTDRRVEAVMRAILIGIPARLPAETRAWLDARR
jgi:hypothetical protein